METNISATTLILTQFAATILGSPNTTKGVSAFWDSFEHLNMRVLQLNLTRASCSPYPIIVWWLPVSMWLPGIQHVGISLVCMKSFLEPLEESKVPLPKEHFFHLQSHLYASKLANIHEIISPVEGMNHNHHYYCTENDYWRFSCH